MNAASPPTPHPRPDAWQRGFWVLVGLILIGRGLLLWTFVEVGGTPVWNDSHHYLRIADALVEHGWFSSSAESYQPEVFRTPGYPLFLAIPKWLGVDNLYLTALVQELIYIATAFLVYSGFRRLFSPSVGQLVLLYLLINPAGLSLPKIIYSETLFFACWVPTMLALGFYFLRRDWHWMLAAGVLLGVATMIRPASTYVPILVLFCLLIWNHRPPNVGWAALAFVVGTAAIVAPWLVRNQQQFGQVFMSGQTSNMITNYHVPRVWAELELMSYDDARTEITSRIKDTIEQADAARDVPLNAVERYQLQQRLGLDELRQHVPTYARIWAQRMGWSVIEPGILHLYRTLNVPLEHLHLLSGAPDGPRLVLRTALAAEWVFRSLLTLFAAIGLVAILLSRNPFLWLVMLVNLYFVFIPGTMGYFRFRFPVEPFWFLQALVGMAWLARRFGVTVLDFPTWYTSRHDN